MQLLIFSFQAQSWINDLNFSLLLEHQDFSNKKFTLFVSSCQIQIGLEQENFTKK